MMTDAQEGSACEPTLENVEERAEPVALGAEEKKILEEKIAGLEQALAEAKDRMLRVAADFENYKKRVQGERDDFFKFASEALLASLLPVLDGFDRALVQSQSTQDVHAILKGLALVKRQFEDILEKVGVKRMETRDRVFDPNLHEAALMEQHQEKLDHVILEELQAGYTLNGRVLRPAMVVVNQLSI